jgi:capsid protein
MNDPRDFKVGRIERFMAPIFPKWAAERTKWKAHMFRYDGARVTTERRKAGFQGTQNPEAMQNVRDRINMLWEARDLAQNSFIFKSILLKVSAYCFGDVKYQGRTGNLRVDKLYNDWIKERSKRVDLGNQMSLRQYCQMQQQSKWGDGDVGTHFVFDETEDLRLQAIECDRIGHPLAIARYDPHYASGVVLDDFGRPTHYRVYQRLDSGLYTNPADIEAENFSLLKMTNRFDQYRGVTAFHACLDTIRDLQEIVGYENIGVKWASAITGLVTKELGDAAQDPDLQLTTDVEPVTGKVSKLETMVPGDVRYLDDAEKFQQLVGMRPADSWQGHMDRLIRHIAACTNTSYSFIYSTMGLNGNTARLESVQMQRTCEIEQKDMEDAWLVDWKDQQIAMGVEDGEIPDHPNKFQGKFLYAAHPTIDVGRESQANLAENRQGLKSASDIYAEQGKDVYEEQYQIASEAGNIVRLANRFKVPVAMIQTLASNGRSDAEPMSGGGSGGGAGPTGMPNTTGRLIDSIGIGGTASLLQVVQAVASGTTPRDSGIHTLIAVFGVSQEDAERIIPAQGSSQIKESNIPAVPKVGTGGGAGAPQKPKPKEPPKKKTNLSLQDAEARAIQEEMDKFHPDSAEYAYLKDKLVALG